MSEHVRQGFISLAGTMIPGLVFAFNAARGGIVTRNTVWEKQDFPILFFIVQGFWALICGLCLLGTVLNFLGVP